MGLVLTTGLLFCTNTIQWLFASTSLQTPLCLLYLSLLTLLFFFWIDCLFSFFGIASCFLSQLFTLRCETSKMQSIRERTVADVPRNRLPLLFRNMSKKY